jgi:hypothetical protein
MVNIDESDLIFESLSADDQAAFRRLEQEFVRGMSDLRSAAKAVRFKHYSPDRSRDLGGR